MLEVEPEKYLSCTICMGIVEDPVTLQCNHTYCRHCMAVYIKSRGDARRNKIIPCALKCEGTKVPDPSKPSEDWANQLKPSFIISNLVDDYMRTAGSQCSRCSRNDTLKSDHESDSKPRLKEYKLPETIECKCSADELEPSIYDITVFEVRGIHIKVVTDYNNHCVKSFFTRNNKPHYSRLALGSEPFGITQLKEKVMVVVPYSIVTIAVTPDLTLLSTMNTSVMYNSLTVMGDTSLVVGGLWCVDILNMKGEVMKSISTLKSTDLFSRPWYMCVSNTGHLLVSDWDQKRVICLTREGEVVWTYTGTGKGELRYPKGITTTTAGDILVADLGLKKVIQLSETGEYVGDVVSSQGELRFPRGICVDKHGSIFVCDRVVVKRFTSV